MPDSRIAGARVDLTPLTVADAEEMTGVLSGDELYKFTGGRPPEFDELRAAYARQVVGHSPDGRQEWRNWIIRRHSDRAAVGYVQATIVDGGKRSEIAWVVGLEWQGRGYAVESARALAAWLEARGVVVIQAHIHPDHAASAAVARQAGLLPTDLFDDGEQLWRRDSPADGAEAGRTFRSDLA
jgi:RimJ/RimL family protein N-acetyltransferase